MGRSRPCSSKSPWRGTRRPATIAPSVDFPLPDGPWTSSRSPWRISRLQSASTGACRPACWNAIDCTCRIVSPGSKRRRWISRCLTTMPRSMPSRPASQPAANRNGSALSSISSHATSHAVSSRPPRTPRPATHHPSSKSTYSTPRASNSAPSLRPSRIAPAALLSSRAIALAPSRERSWPLQPLMAEARFTSDESTNP